GTQSNINYGTRETAEALKNLPVDATTRKIAFRLEPWSGLLFLDNASIQIIGVSIARSTAKKWQHHPVGMEALKLCTGSTRTDYVAVSIV
ncbi:hypothetical protein L7Q18_32705, partial [Achromobacter xylosoxidans]|uniref:hypothetical protein n=1 Tax=Alcaligenes xylosoxydans xylosoxydans TaxID=85698 RepID=UPI001F06A237